MRKIAVLILSLSVLDSIHAQTNSFPGTGAVGIGTLNPDASSLLDIASTTTGVLVPRMTQAQRDAIVTPATGLLIYQTTNTPGFYYYGGSGWTAISSKDANRSLSNLTSTAVSQSLVAGTTNSFDLGSFALRWKNMYLSGDAYVNGKAYINGLTVGIGGGSVSTNTATGYAPLYANTTGYRNTAYGFQTLYNNTTGRSNTANGAYALLSNTSGSYNVANGESALYKHISGNYNTAVGSEALLTDTTGFSNTAIGMNALYSNSSGNSNTAIGQNALLSNTTGSENTASGTAALSVNTTGTRNAAFGVSANVSSNNLINATAIGYSATVNASNKIRLGNSSVTVVESQAGSWTVSDGRFKDNIKEDVKGLDFIKLLRPVTYNFDSKKFEEFLMKQYPDSVKKKRMAAMQESFAKTSSVRQTGFVAQDVEAAAKKAGYNFNGIHAPENATDNWSISYEKLVVPLVKAVQELSAANDAKDAKLDEQQKINAALQKQIDDLKLIMQQTVQQCSQSGAVNSQTVNSIISDRAALEQNIPNPFQHATMIGYTLPTRYARAQMVITDKAGKTLKTLNVSGSGKGRLNVDASTLSSGAYQYSLYIDGKLIDTKQMVLAK